jgi:hypothetical protein
MAGTILSCEAEIFTGPILENLSQKPRPVTRVAASIGGVGRQYLDTAGLRP